MNPSIQASAAASSIHKVTNLVIASVLLMVGLYAFDQWGQVKEREEQHMRSNLMLLTRTLDTFFLSKRAGMFSLAETMVSPQVASTTWRWRSNCWRTTASTALKSARSP